MAPVRIRQSRCEMKTGVWVSGLMLAPTPSCVSPRAPAQASADHNRCACVIMTPFGAPVVPDV